MVIDDRLKPEDLKERLKLFWDLSGEKILRIESEFNPEKGAPVFTVNGKYVPRGWTEWTQGFQFGSSLLQFDATGNEEFLKLGRDYTLKKMPPYLTHTGVHDHGFNNLSTYGNLFRLMKEGKIPGNERELEIYRLAVKVSGAVQAGRWTKTRDGGFIFSFNGPQSLFVDTIRSCRVLMLSHLLGHFLQGESDVHISLFDRAVEHILSTAKFSVYYGEGRDMYDEWGRTAHESLFNPLSGDYRCPNSQQGYSGFTTWTRGLAWAMLGFAEELELLNLLPEPLFENHGGKEQVLAVMMRAARATCDFYISHTPSDGIPYWDTGAPGLTKMGDYLNRPADPFNDAEPVDSSAAAIGVQGLLRLGHFLLSEKHDPSGEHYWQAGLTITGRLLEPPYLSTENSHQGILLHGVYHRPNGWDHIPAGYRIPCNESVMWGDYHIREAALFLSRIVENGRYLMFFNGIE